MRACTTRSVVVDGYLSMLPPALETPTATAMAMAATISSPAALAVEEAPATNHQIRESVRFSWENTRDRSLSPLAPSPSCSHQTKAQVTIRESDRSVVSLPFSPPISSSRHVMEPTTTTDAPDEWVERAHTVLLGQRGSREHQVARREPAIGHHVDRRAEFVRDLLRETREHTTRRRVREDLRREHRAGGLEVAGTDAREHDVDRRHAALGLAYDRPVRSVSRERLEADLPRANLSVCEASMVVRQCKVNDSGVCLSQPCS